MKKQSDLPAMTGDGVEEKRIKPLDDAIDTYEDAKDKRITLTEKETETRTKVQDMMAKHGVKKYRRDSTLYTLDPKLKTTKIKQPKE